MEKNRKKLIGQFFLMNAALVIAAVAFLLIALLKQRVYLPIFECVTYKFFHLYCPLCGGTRAIFALLGLDVISAVKYNPFLFYLALAFVAYEIKAGVSAFKGKIDAFIVPKWLVWVTSALFVAFFIGRNLLMIAWGIDPIGDLVGYWR